MVASLLGSVACERRPIGFFDSGSQCQHETEARKGALPQNIEDRSCWVIALSQEPAYSAATGQESNMTMPSTVKAARPLSPHLQVYKPQLTSGMSIFHRLTGVALAIGLPVFVLWLLALASGPQRYWHFIGSFQTTLGQILLFGWTFSFFYHLFCGMRHLLWSAGYFLDIKSVYSTGRIVIGVSVLLTIGLWFKIYGVLPCGEWML
jgi:succinate dehydrogenase / fumarate reductase cytochrome b subunit